MKELGPYEVNVTIEARRMITEGMEIMTPMVTAIDAGEKVTRRQIDQTVEEAIIDWCREHRHEQKEDQEGPASDVQAAPEEEGSGADEEAPRVPNPGGPAEA